MKKLVFSDSLNMNNDIYKCKTASIQSFLKLQVQDKLQDKMCRHSISSNLDQQIVLL